MALTLQNYLIQINQALKISLCLRDFPSETTEKHNKPQIEMFSLTQESKPLTLNPIFIARNEKEKCLIEPSINSCRISFGIRQNDDIDQLIVSKFAKFFEARADQFDILRREAQIGYDVSFLVTNQHLERYDKAKIIDFIISFIQDIEKDISQIKLNIITQTRAAALFYVTQLAAK